MHPSVSLIIKYHHHSHHSRKMAEKKGEEKVGRWKRREKGRREWIEKEEEKS